MARRGATSTELARARLVARFLGCDIEPAEDGRTPRQVDFWLLRGGQRMGALEVTTATDPREMATAEVAGIKWAVASRRSWWLSYDRPIDIRRARQHVPDLVALCDEQDVTDARHLIDVQTAATAWLRSAPVTLRASSGGSEGTVWIVRAPIASFVPDHADDVLSWLDDCLVTSCASKVAKLLEQDVEERHLVIAVDYVGVPPVVVQVLAGEPQVPVRDPIGVSGLRGVWLLPRFGRSIVRWDCEGGWTRLRVT